MRSRLEQLRAEKSGLKAALRTFDTKFAEKHGRNVRARRRVAVCVGLVSGSPATTSDSVSRVIPSPLLPHRSPAKTKKSICGRSTSATTT